MPIIIDGRKRSNEIKEKLEKETGLFKSEKGITPGLAVILVGDNPASKVYVNMKEKACEQLGFKSFKYNFDKNATEQELISCIDDMNKNPEVHGILVQLPLPEHINEQKIIFKIDPEKDVDGFHPENLGKLMIGCPKYLPCTPLGIQKLLEYYEIQTTGKNVVVVGRSNIVGKPIGMMLLQKQDYGNASVIYCHSKSENLNELIKLADILIVAVGRTNFIKKDMVKQGVVVIDVGINRVEDNSFEKGYRIVGDVDFEDVKEKTFAITPVPGGVGPMTIAMLMDNTLRAAKK